jgi:putative membrane protein
MNTKSTSLAPPYSNGKLILRDVLAVDRTRLANERTLLAWLRTALMELVSGITLIKLFEGVLLAEIIGFSLLPLGLITAAYGIHRFFRVRALILNAERNGG